MSFSIIVATTKDLLIGRNNQLPWHLPEDLKFFKTTTSGHKIIMGRKTFASIGKALPTRTNIILTHDVNFHVNDVIVFHDFDTLLKTYQSLNEEIFVIGGTSLFDLFLPHTQKIYHTLIHSDSINGDTYFPNWEYVKDNFKLTQSSSLLHSDTAKLDYQFCTWENNNR